MTFKINFKSIANLIMILIVGQLVLFRFFNIHETVNKVIIIFIFLQMFLALVNRPRKTQNNNFEIICWVTLFILLGVNGFFYGFGPIYKSNMLILLYPMIYMIYITWYVKRYQDFFYSMMIRLKYVVNIYFIINIIVIFIQLKGTYFMVGFSNVENSLYVDLISGLFGYSMTSALCFFSVFIVVYNIAISKTIKSEFKRKLFIIYNVALTLVVAYISTKNDNVAYFAILPLALMIVVFSEYRIKTATGIQKMLMLCLIVFFTISLVLFLSPDLYEYLYEKVFYKYIGAIEQMNEGAAVTHGSMERLALVVYGFRYANGWGIGDGFGTSGLYTARTYGFLHFGNANIGSLICLGGVWVYLFWICIYTCRFVGMINYNVKKDNTLFYMCALFFFYIVATLFTIPLTDISIGLSTMFIVLAFGLNNYLANVTESNSI